MVLREELSILESCCLRPIMRNSVLEQLEEDTQTSKRKSVAQLHSGLKVGDT